jgi:hypothetical protein
VAEAGLRRNSEARSRPRNWFCEPGFFHSLNGVVALSRVWPEELASMISQNICADLISAFSSP